MNYGRVQQLVSAGHITPAEAAEIIMAPRWLEMADRWYRLSGLLTAGLVAIAALEIAIGWAGL